MTRVGGRADDPPEARPARRLQADVAFFDLFAGDEPEFEAAALNVIEGGLDRGVLATAVREAAELLQAYELMYWDALRAASSRA